MSVVSHIIEATNFSPTRCDFNIPQILAEKITLAGVGVYGAQGRPSDPVIGQLGVIKSITLKDGGVILSQISRDFSTIVRFKLLAQSSNEDFRAKRRHRDGSNFGVEFRRGGAAGTTQPGAAGRTCEAATNPRVCVDKKDASFIDTVADNTRFASLNLADVLGWCNAFYSSGETMVSSAMPCHIHNLKLSIEFNDPATVLAGTVVNQPYLIMHEIRDQQLENAFMNKNLVARYADWDEEIVRLGVNTSSKVFLNSFIGRTLSKLMFMPTQAGGPQALAYPDEVFRMLVNNMPYTELSTGINHPGKKLMFTRQAGYELPVPLNSEKPVANVTVSQPDAPEAVGNVTASIEGTNAADTSGTLSHRADFSYLVMDINQKIENLQLDYALAAAPAAITDLKFFGLCEKQVAFSSSAPVVSFA